MSRVLTKHVCNVPIVDPDTEGEVEVEIRKLESGALVGLDSSFLEQLAEGDAVYSPYDEGIEIEVPDDEPSPAGMSRMEEALTRILNYQETVPCFEEVRKIAAAGLGLPMRQETPGQTSLFPNTEGLYQHLLSCGYDTLMSKAVERAYQHGKGPEATARKIAKVYPPTSVEALAQEISDWEQSVRNSVDLSDSLMQAFVTDGEDYDPEPEDT